jgi:ferric-dicitrate binding protein FerR (iron transport regulator)
MTDAAGKLRPDEAYRRFMFRLNREATTKPAKEPRLNTLFRTIRRVAAIVTVSFASGAACHYYWAKQPEQVAFVETIVPLGSKSELKLPDGSTVWLNAGSTLRYPTDYGRATRDIYLEGEGYFKVAKQQEKPFTVHTAWSKIRALGTEFNVKAYPGEELVETTLIKGEVAIEKSGADGAVDQAVRLKPGQKLLVVAPTKAVTESAGDLQPEAPATAPDPIRPVPAVEQLPPDIAEAEVSWKEQQWRIESAPLQDLAIKLGRRYNVHIRVDESLKNHRFTGTLKDESLEQVLHAMQLSSPILFVVDGKNVSISVDPKK